MNMGNVVVKDTSTIDDLQDVRTIKQRKEQRPSPLRQCFAGGS